MKVRSWKAFTESLIDDIRYALVVLGCIKAGYKVLFLASSAS